MRFQTLVFLIVATVFAHHGQAQIASSLGACGLNSGTPSVACITEQDTTKPCPDGYRSDGEYCITDDPSSEFPTLKKASCPMGFEEQDNRCISNPGSH
jgi:hypothetical protein